MTFFPRKDDHSAVWKLGELAQYQINGLWPQANGRAVFMGGKTPSETATITFIQAASTGDATDFGDLSSSKYNMGSGSSGVRGLSLGGYDGYPSQSSVIDVLHFATTGNAAHMGSLSSGRGSTTGASNENISLSLGHGDNTAGYSNVIDRTNNASIGTATDFGDLTQSRGQGGSVNNATTALAAGGIISTNW